MLGHPRPVIKGSVGRAVVVSRKPGEERGGLLTSLEAGKSGKRRGRLSPDAQGELGEHPQLSLAPHEVFQAVIPGFEGEHLTSRQGNAGG